MEVISLSHRRLPGVPHIDNAATPDFDSAREARLSPHAREYACKWQLGVTAATDMLHAEYNALFTFLLRSNPELENGRALFLGCGRGQAVDAALQLYSALEWMATGFEPSSSPCPFDEHLQAATLPSGQLCIFRPQFAEQYSDEHCAAILGAITQYCSVVVVDDLVNSEFGLRIALERVQPGGALVWHVDNHVFYNSQALIASTLMTRFERVSIATARVHDTYASHFIVCCDAYAQPQPQSVTKRVSPDLVNDLLDRWIAQRNSDYYDYVCLATYFDAIGLSSSAAVAAHWAAHSAVYNTTALINAKQDIIA